MDNKMMSTNGLDLHSIKDAIRIGYEIDVEEPVREFCTKIGKHVSLMGYNPTLIATMASVSEQTVRNFLDGKTSNINCIAACLCVISRKGREPERAEVWEKALVQAFKRMGDLQQLKRATMEPLD